VLRNRHVLNSVPLCAKVIRRRRTPLVLESGCTREAQKKSAFALRFVLFCLTPSLVSILHDPKYSFNSVKTILFPALSLGHGETFLLLMCSV